MRRLTKLFSSLFTFPHPRPAQRTRLAVLSAFAMATVALSIYALIAPPGARGLSSDVVISQVYGGGGATSGTPTYINDYIELFNRGNSPVTLTGYALQYGSSAGNFGASASQIYAISTVTIQPGKYLLIQVGGAGTVGAALPVTPDQTTGNISMSAASGKIALANTATGLGCGATATPCTLPDVRIVDSVSYGASNNGEGGTTVNNGSALTNTQGGVRKTNGCTETDNNNSDFSVVTAPVPRNSATAANPCTPLTPTLSINDVTMSEGNAGTTIFTFTVSLNSAAGAGGVSFDIATADGTATTADNDYVAANQAGKTIAAGQTSTTFDVTVNGDTTFEPNETFFVNVTNVSGATLGDGQGQGTINNDDVSPLPLLSINDVSAAEGNAGTTTFTFTVSLSMPAGAGGVSFDIATADGTATVANNDYVAAAQMGKTIAAGQSSTTFDVMVNGDTAGEPDETFTVNITNVSGASLNDGTGLGTIQNDDLNLTLIHDIQGTSETPNFVGQSKIIQGIVVGNFQTSAGLSGFFVEEEQSDWDADPNTSEGIFVFDGATPVTTVNVGDKVTVTGTVLNFGGPPGLTELSPTTSVVVNSSGNTLPPAQTVTLPVGTSPATDLEKYEGMRVQFAQSLFVTGNADLAHFGELNLSANSKLYIPTNSVDPNDNPASGNSISGNSNVPAVTAQQTLNNNSRIILDDGKSGTYPNPIPFLGAGTNATIRLGDSVSSLSGVMSYGFGSYRIEPTGPVAFNALNPRPAAPASVGNSTLRVVSFNVENYFATTGTGRGPDNATELQRKRAKVAAALAGLNADVIGLIELEKGTQAVPDAAVNDIISALNTLGVGTYAAVSTPTAVYTVPVGTDTDIKSGIIYRTSAVTTVGASFTDTTAPVGTYSRAPIAQTFQQTSNGEKFTFVVNHFRSKGCSGGSGLDADQGDGQACFNDRRRNQAQSVVAFVNSTILPIDPDVLVVGDLNAYGQEDPVDVFRAAGYSDVVGQYVSLADQYSFTFSGEIGRLDHAFATGNLANQITGGTIWHINADEPAAFDYNTENKPDDRYAPTPYASADHNPVLVGIALSSAPCPTITVTPSSVPAGTAGAAYGPVQFSQTGGNGTITWSVSSNNLPAGLTLNPMTGQLSGTPAVAAGVNVTIRATDQNNCFGEVTVTLQINCPTITINPSSGSPTVLTGGTVGQAYSQTFTAAPAGGGYTYSIPAPSIPPGLTFSTSTGVLSGTPTTTGTFTFTVTATGFGNCGGTQTYTLTIGCQTITFTPAGPALTGGTVNSLYSQQLTANNAGGNVNFTLQSGTFPAGVSMNLAGLISGTPTAPGTSNFTIKATDANGCMATQAYSLTIGCQSITVNPAGPALPAGMSGTLYSQTFSQIGGSGTTTFSISAGTPPTGLTLSGATLSGTPTVFGNFSFTIRATDNNGCFGERAYTLVINSPCGTINVTPMTVPNGFVGTAYSATFNAGGGTAPYSFNISAGAQPTGLTLATGGALTGTPTATGTFNFTVKATDANGCMGTQAYTVIISGSGLQFYPLPAPVRLLDTRSGAGISGCTIGTGALAASATRTQPAVSVCSMIPANAAAVIGNITVVPAAPGFLTLFPSDATQPTVANSNFQAGEITNNFFTVGLGKTGPDAGAFKIFVSAETHVIIDLTGYYAPPGAGGLFYHPLPTPVRLVETRSQFSGCFQPAQLIGTGNPNADPNLDLSVLGRPPGVPSPCNSIPNDAAVLVGNATSVVPSGGGFLTIYPSDATRSAIASSNYAGNDVINGPFAVKLGADGKFKVYTLATTHLVIDITGYYSASPVDANGAGLLFNPLPKPLRLLETRPDFPNLTLVGCYRPNAPIPGGTGGIRTQQVWGLCSDQPITIPTTARAAVGNVTAVATEGAGFLTFFPGDVINAPTIATSNYPTPASFGYNRHYYVGLSPANGTFKILTQHTTHLVVDVSGYFEP